MLVYFIFLNYKTSITLYDFVQLNTYKNKYKMQRRKIYQISNISIKDKEVRVYRIFFNSKNIINLLFFIKKTRNISFNKKSSYPLPYITFFISLVVCFLLYWFVGEYTPPKVGFMAAAYLMVGPIIVFVLDFIFNYSNINNELILEFQKNQIIFNKREVFLGTLAMLSINYFLFLFVIIREIIFTMRDIWARNKKYYNLMFYGF
ncbi:MAG: hypothetical protein E7Y34_01915 [Mycoplasma sp.]|nr:hypothetical protein [Mycoplasma sp.]